MAGRDIKTNADYFTHDADMRNDARIKALRRKFGHEGYAVWNYLLEVLTDSNDFEIPWTKLDIELISGDFDVQPEQLIAIVGYCQEIQLLSVVDGKLFSQKHKDRFEKMMSKRTQDRDRIAEKRVKNRPEVVVTNDDTTTNNTNCSDDNEQQRELSPLQPATITQSRVEYSRVEESRVEKKESNINSLSLSESGGDATAEKETFFEILECFYFRALPDPWREVERFMDHYTGVGWVNKNGRKIKDKLAVARNWEPQNKPTKPPMPKDVLEWIRPIYEHVKQTNPKQVRALLNVFGVVKNDKKKELVFLVRLVKNMESEKEFWSKMLAVITRSMQENDPLKGYVISANLKK